VFHADRELLSATKLILETKNPTYRAVADVRSEASGSWRTVTLPFPEAGIRLLLQNSLGVFARTLVQYRERLPLAARELAAEYDKLKLEAQHRIGTLLRRPTAPRRSTGCSPPKSPDPRSSRPTIFLRDESAYRPTRPKSGWSRAADLRHNTRQDFGSFRFTDRHAGHHEDGPGERLGTIRGNRVAFRVADVSHPRFPRLEPCSFESSIAHS
jgi:hypothetical protein